MGDIVPLPSGLVVELEMPNLYGILAGVGRVPNPLLAPVLDLLIKDRSYTPGGPDADVYVRKVQEIRGMYAVMALCAVRPRLRLDGEPQEGEIGPADVSYDDLEVVYWGYFRGRRASARALAAAVDPERAAEPASPGDDVPHDAGGAAAA